MREGRKVTMGRYSRKQSACAGKESAEDFGKRREDQREISAHLQLNYANTPRAVARGLLFYSLLSVRCAQLLFASTLSGLPLSTRLCKSHRADAGEFCILFSPSVGILYIIFLLLLYGESWGGNHIINCPKQFSSVNALPYRV